MTENRSCDALIFIDPACTGDHDLTFNDMFIPLHLSKLVVKKNIASNIYFALPQSYRGPLESEKNIIRYSNVDDVVFWKKLFSTSKANHFIKLSGDMPFADSDILREMKQLHLDYLAEFTYSDNLPPGFSCQVLSRKLIENLPDTDEKTLSLPSVVTSNINQFDVELYYRDPDLRNYRLSFKNSDPRDRKVMEEIVSIQGNIPAYGQVKEIIESNPRLLALSPSYVEFELNGSCELDCMFCYRKSISPSREPMKRQVLEKVLADMKSFNMPYTICLGGSGEPLDHPEFYGFMDQILSDSLVERVVVETAGYGMDGNYRSLCSGEHSSRITTIVNLSALNQETYTSIHGTGDYAIVEKNILELNSQKKDSKLFVQLLKINETEPFTDKYYDKWEEAGIPVLFQKQNTFLGLVEDRRYSDLSPLVRYHCWHLARDCNVLADGTISFCKQDVKGENSLGNIQNDDLADIWKARIEHLNDNFESTYPSSPSCETCDEWYTFNY